MHVVGSHFVYLFLCFFLDSFKGLAMGSSSFPLVLTPHPCRHQPTHTNIFPPSHIHLVILCCRSLSSCSWSTYCTPTFVYLCALSTWPCSNVLRCDGMHMCLLKPCLVYPSIRGRVVGYIDWLIHFFPHLSLARFIGKRIYVMAVTTESRDVGVIHQERSMI